MVTQAESAIETAAGRPIEMVFEMYSQIRDVPPFNDTHIPTGLKRVSDELGDEIAFLANPDGRISWTRLPQSIAIYNGLAIRVEKELAGEAMTDPRPVVKKYRKNLMQLAAALRAAARTMKTYERNVRMNKARMKKKRVIRVTVKPPRQNTILERAMRYV